MLKASTGSRRGQNAFGRFHIGAVEPQSFGELEPALDAALGADIAVVVLDAVAPFRADAAVAEREITTASLIGMCSGKRAVRRQGLHWPLFNLPPCSSR